MARMAYLLSGLDQGSPKVRIAKTYNNFVNTPYF